MALVLVKRLAQGCMTLLLVSGFVFAATNLLPGDVAAALLGEHATPEALAAIRRSLGLNQPALYRYWIWLTHFVSGDLGTSLANGQPIGAIVAIRFYNTLFLAAVTAAVSVPISILLGALAAAHRGRWLDRMVSGATLVLVSVPEFFLGYLLIMLLSRYLAVFPSMAQIPPDASLTQHLFAIGLPVLTLALGVMAYLVRMVRAAIVEVMSASYIEMALLQGASEHEIVLRHALPNVIGPLINIIVFNLAYLVVGVIIVEVIFVYPGIGQLMADAVAARDVTTAQACALIFAVTYVGLNITADLVATLTNPRLRVRAA
ncbi:MAG: ABC transporter permease [Alphaproteobacteria bacterium]|nr:ABC transporter permease [Alphaproteobacteria bacterium]